MDKFGNPIPGSSKEFDSDFQCLETEFIANDANKDVFICSLTNNVLNKDQTKPSSTHNIEEFFDEIQSIDFNKNQDSINEDQTKRSSTHNIEEFFDEIQSIDLNKNKDSGQDNTILLELLERTKNLIGIVKRNLVDLDEIIVGIDENIACSVRNATKANDAIEYEKKSLMKIADKKLKNKANLANFFKIGSSNCPQNPHLAEVYDDGRLVLSYNGRFMLEECVEKNLWNQDFKNKLEQAVYTEVLEKVKTPLYTQYVQLGEDLRFQDDPEFKNKTELEKKAIENKLDIISKMPFKQLIFQFTDSLTEYDWLKIGKITNKPDLQCKRFWHLLVKPFISRAKWTESENNQLIEIAKKYKEKNWHQIAVELNTNRNEFQCLVHYQKINKSLYKTGKWSIEEDNKLMKIVKKYTIDNIIFWQKVYFAMLNEGRTVEQIYNRWMFSLRPGIKKGPLTQEERLLIKTAQINKLPPFVVSMNLLNRTTTQIRNAYHRNSQSKNKVRGGWMLEEDEMLLRAVHSHGSTLPWSQLAQQVPGRTAEQCRHRYKLIEKKLQKDPEITIDNFNRYKRAYHVTEESIDLDENQLQESFKQNHLNLKLLKKEKEVETVADRKLKQAYLDNVYITKYCNFSSKCELLKYMLDYLGADDLVVPEKFIHEDDLIDEGLMSMMTYLKKNTNKSLTLKSCSIKRNTTDGKSTYDGIHGVLRTSDIINSDISEIEGLLDIRIRNHHDKSISQSIDNQNSASIQKCSLVKSSKPLPLYYMGSVPPNYETFRMLYSYISNLNISMKTNSLKTHNFKFDWDSEESKKLHQRLVAIFRWPALFSGLVNYNTEKINIISNTKQPIDLNCSAYPYVGAKKRKL